ncbi:hypothetical protein DC083_00205 [Ignatzschineria ureiclastica]|uniref:LemA family protein n=1 Tax=Ignatzschineria ureiclastica TaxID=472582 RepID=A0A2U2AG96_9GAMM|nr:LemA family protein [Ignatzschineria ureiclastica]PWD81660.1 hypothetical protein DC083_00205 [Ignatzschineria ureiclastica]GGZ89683.1 hypothetical protein GCM10007162_00400 [Ignatzschineria ureiclastica]
MKPANWAFIPIALIVIVVGFLSMGYYNTIQDLAEKQNATAAEIINQYQRRADLITNLANTVKGYSNHEQSIFTEIANSRAKLGSMQINPDDFRDPAKLEAYEDAQQTLQSQLSKLMVIVENYPDLKASNLYQNLMVQLEGTENRVAVARNRNIEAVREYNTLIRRFPYVLLAKVLGYSPLPQMSAAPGIEQAPVISF